MVIEEKLRKMGLELPAVAEPAGLYVYTRRVGNLVYVSGQTPDINSVLQYKGIVGETLSIEECQRIRKLSVIVILIVNYASHKTGDNPDKDAHIQSGSSQH